MDITTRKMKQNNDMQVENELKNNQDFTQEELEMLSDGILKLIADTSKAKQLITDRNVIEAMHDLTNKYRTLNKKICDMIN